jgi:hypothetical protein
MYVIGWRARAQPLRHLRYFRDQGCHWQLHILGRDCQLLAGEYEDAIARCQENYDAIDNLMFRASYPSDFGWNPVHVFWLRSTAWLRLYGLFFMAVALPPVIAFAFLVH